MYFQMKRMMDLFLEVDVHKRSRLYWVGYVLHIIKVLKMIA